MKWLAGWAALLVAGACFAQPGPVQPEPQGLPQAGQVVADGEFGVVTRQLGLQRQVEMYQWRPSGPGYGKAWSADRIDSKAFAPGHENPVEFPLQGRQWIADEILLDGKQVDPTVLKALARWRQYRPDFSALPGNLSATFQPEGDGLGSALNPLDPQVGDLRVTWHELSLPALTGEVALSNDVWMLARPRPGDSATLATRGQGGADYSRTQVGAFVAAGLLVLVLIVLAIYMKNRRR